MKSEHLARAAYVAYAEARKWRGADGKLMQQFSHLPEPDKQAWCNVAESVLQTWLDTDFRASLTDRQRIQSDFVDQLKIGLLHGDGICQASALGMASYLIAMIDPEAPRRAKIEDI